MLTGAGSWPTTSVDGPGSGNLYFVQLFGADPINPRAPGAGSGSEEAAVHAERVVGPRSPLSSRSTDSAGSASQKTAESSCTSRIRRLGCT